MLRIVAFVLTTLFCTTQLLAHGSQIQLTNDGGKITTRRVMVDIYGPTITDPTRVYILPIVPAPNLLPPADTGTMWTTYPTVTQPSYNSGPGIAYGYGGFAVNQTFTMSILDGLKRWDGTSFVDPGTEQVEIFRASAFAAAPNPSAVTTDSGPYGTLPIPYTTITPTTHSTIRYRLLGDRSAEPNTVNDRLLVPDDGLYLLSLQLSTSEMGVAPSDPFYFLLNKNADQTAINGAVAALGLPLSQVQAIPEPGTYAVLACCTLGYIVYRRRRS